jgi:hypothetical protein
MARDIRNKEMNSKYCCKKCNDNTAMFSCQLDPITRWRNVHGDAESVAEHHIHVEKSQLVKLKILKMFWAAYFPDLWRLWSWQLKLE